MLLLGIIFLLILYLTLIKNCFFICYNKNLIKSYLLRSKRFLEKKNHWKYNIS